MKKYNRLAVALLDLRTDPPLSLIVVFLCGALILAVLGNYAYSWATDERASLEKMLIIVGALLLAAGLAYWRYSQTLGERTNAVERSQFLPARYLLSGLSPYSIQPSGVDNLENVRRLLLHNKETVQTLYLVSILEQKTTGIAVHNTRYTENSSEKVKEAHRKLLEWLDENFETLPQVILLPLTDANSAETSYRVVSDILERFRTKNIPNTDVLVDVTAGTKAMTVGLAMAALVNGYRVSYQATRRDAEGVPVVESPETSLVALDLQHHLRLVSENTTT